MVHASQIAGVTPLDLAKGTSKRVSAVPQINEELARYLESVGESNPFKNKLAGRLGPQTRAEVLVAPDEKKPKPSVKKLAYRETFTGAAEKKGPKLENTLFVTAEELPMVSQSGRERNKVFVSTGKGTFMDLSGVAGGDHMGDGRSLATADFDGDGDVDVVVRNMQTPKVVYLENVTPKQGHFLNLKLTSTSGPKDAIGAVVRVETADQTQTQQVVAGHNYLGQSSIELEFGLGKHTEALSIEVKWPLGKTQRFEKVAADRFLSIVEGQSSLKTRK